MKHTSDGALSRWKNFLANLQTPKPAPPVGSRHRTAMFVGLGSVNRFNTGAFKTIPPISCARRGIR